MSLFVSILMHWLHQFWNRCALSQMTPTSYLEGVAFDYTVHMILTSYLVGVAYNYTVYHFECYNSSLLCETCFTLNTTHLHLPFECYNSFLPWETFFTLNTAFLHLPFECYSSSHLQETCVTLNTFTFQCLNFAINNSPYQSVSGV